MPHDPWHSIAFRKTHSLEEIGEQCLRIDGTLKPLVDRAVPLRTMRSSSAGGRICSLS